MLKRISFISFLLTTIWFVTYSQEPDRQRGLLWGIVRNAETIEPLPGANIIIEGTTLGGITNPDGSFTVENIPVGAYVIKVSQIGYKVSMSTDVVITASKPSVLDILLTPTNISIDEINVIADYFQRSPDAFLSTQSQSYEEIRQLPGGLEDVVRAISILPGVAQVQAGRNDLIVRGGAPSENLFLIDNIEVPNINHFGTQGASGGPLSFVNLDFVRGTTFSSGGFGVKYGNKLSSLLTIDLRDGRTDRLGGKATLAATQFGLNVEGPVSDRGSFLFSARRSYLDFIFKAAGFGFVPEYWDFLGKGSYRLDDKNRLSLLAIAAIDRTKFFDETADKRYDNSRILGSNQDQFVGGVTWQHLFPTGFTMISSGFQTVEFSYKQHDSLLQTLFSNQSREQEISLSSEIVTRFSKETEVSAGVQGKVTMAKTEIDLPQFQTSFGQQLAYSGVRDTTLFKGAAFAQLLEQLGNLSVTAGVRLDYFSSLENGTTISPRLSASYQFNPMTSVTFSAGKYYQSPSYIWLLTNRNNTELSPISVDQFIVRMERLVREDTKLSLEGYIKRYHTYAVSTLRTYLSMANTGAGFGGIEEGFASFGFDSLVSIGTGEAHGIEFLAQKKFSEIPCYGTFSISYNESRFTALDGMSRPGSFDQRWIINIGGGYTFNERWEASAKFRYATGRPFTPYNSDGSKSSSLYNTDRVGVNHSLDVRVDRRWLYDSWTLIAYVDIQNVYNKKPIDVPRYDKRTQAIKTSNAIGILPSIGISAEF